MSAYGGSGTIYDAPPARPFTFKVGSADLNEQLGGGFQAAHIWVNNQSNQSLYLPDAPDVVPPGATRVVACSRTDVARASWTIPPAFAITQPGSPAGAAIIVFLNAGVDVAPDPGVTQNPQVTIATGQSIAVSAIQSTVTVAGTVNIGNTPAVTISGTPTVNINSGTVSITGTPNINILSQSVNVAVNQPQSALANLVFPSGGPTTKTTDVVPSGTHALALLLTGTNTLQGMQVKGHSSGVFYFPVDLTYTSSYSFTAPQMIVIPVQSVTDTQYDVIVNNATGTGVTVNVFAVLDAEAVWIQNTHATPIFVRDDNPVQWSATGTLAPVAGSRAGVFTTAVTGTQWKAHSMTAEISCGTTGYIGNYVNLIDGVSGGTPKQMSRVLSVAANTGFAFGIENQRFIGTAATQSNWEFAASASGQLQSVTAGWYTQVA